MRNSKFKSALAKRFASEMELAEANNNNAGLVITPLIPSEDVPASQPSRMVESDAAPMTLAVEELQFEKGVAGEADTEDNKFEEAETSTANDDSSSSTVEVIVKGEELQVKYEGPPPGEGFSVLAEFASAFENHRTKRRCLRVEIRASADDEDHNDRRSPFWCPKTPLPSPEGQPDPKDGPFGESS